MAAIDQDGLADHLGMGFQAGGQVDGIAHAGVGGPADGAGVPGDHLAGGDPDPDADLDLALRQPVRVQQAGSYRSYPGSLDGMFTMVGLGQGCPKNGHQARRRPSG